MLSFGKFHQWSLYLTPQKGLDHHLTHSLNRPHVSVVLSSGLIPMDSIFSSNSTPMVPATGKCASTFSTLFPGDYDNLLQWPFSKLILIGIRDQLDPLNTWTITIQPDQDPAYKRPTVSTKTGVATIIINNFIPHSKLFSKTEGFLIDGASYIEIKFSDPPVLKSHTHTSLFFPFL